eukprot:5502-Heterococcus_DN1.PRE.3
MITPIHAASVCPCTLSKKRSRSAPRDCEATRCRRRAPLLDAALTLVLLLVQQRHPGVAAAPLAASSAAHRAQQPSIFRKRALGLRGGETPPLPPPSAPDAAQSIAQALRLQRPLLAEDAQRSTGDEVPSDSSSSSDDSELTAALVSTMYVRKRDGRREPVMFDKITARIHRL